MFGSSFKEAVKRDPLVRLFRKLTSPPDPADWNYKQGKKFLNYRSKKFNYSLAIVHLKEAVRLVPENALFHASLGEALLAAPSMAVFRWAKADFSLRLAAELAQPELNKAMRLAPAFAWPYYLMAVSYEYLGQMDKARQFCRQAVGVTSFPENIRTTFEAFGKALDNAVVLAQDVAAFRQREEECMAHLTRVLALRDKGKYREAEKELEKASKVSPGGAWLYGKLCELGTSPSN
jgi:tetratricopeptide (TPR) repeat protein